MTEKKEIESSYTGSSVHVFAGSKAVRKRPAMYIGDISERGIHHLVNETIDNSIDDAMAGYCTDINVTINEDNSVAVEDNGCGVLSDGHPEIYTFGEVLTMSPSEIREAGYRSLKSSGEAGGSFARICTALGTGVGLGKSCVQRFVSRIRRSTKLSDHNKNKEDKEARKLEITSNGTRVGKRVNNGRVYRLCELLTDDEVFRLMQECHQEFMNFALCASGLIKKFLCAFTRAFYKQSDIKEETDGYRKLAHLHSMVESKLGELVGCGLRTLQKGIVWLAQDVKNVIGREKAKLVQWKNLEDQIADYLSVRIAEVSVVNN